MNPAEIDHIPAGPELDALVAEKVMGCKVLTGSDGAPGQAGRDAAKGKGMKDGDFVIVVVCSKCGPICVTDKVSIEYARMREHRDAHGGDHRTYSSTIGFSTEEEVKA